MTSRITDKRIKEIDKKEKWIKTIEAEDKVPVTAIHRGMHHIGRETIENKYPGSAGF